MFQLNPFGPLTILASLIYGVDDGENTWKVNWAHTSIGSDLSTVGIHRGRTVVSVYNEETE